jgi:hypothetical protein
MLAFAAGASEFLEGHAAFALEADVDDGEVLLDRDHTMPLTTEPSCEDPPAKDSFEQRGEIVAGRGGRRRIRNHLFSRCGISPAVRVDGRTAREVSGFRKP